MFGKHNVKMYTLTIRWMVEWETSHKCHKRSTYHTLRNRKTELTIKNFKVKANTASRILRYSKVLEGGDHTKDPKDEGTIIVTVTQKYMDNGSSVPVGLVNH